MRNNTCVVCFKEFEPREGKLYCSNACKQKAFADRQQETGEIQEKEQEKQKIRKQLEFYLADFQDYKKKYPKSIDSFLIYCFFRKNFEGLFDAEQFHNYIETFEGWWWEEFWNDENSIAKKKFKEFEARFFSDEVKIYFKKSR